MDSRFADRCPQAGLAQSPRALGSGVSRPTMYNLRQQAQSFVQDILCGVDIPVVDNAADRANPLADGQILCAGPLSATIGAQLRGREEAAYGDRLFPIPRRLVLQLPTELAPGCI